MRDEGKGNPHHNGESVSVYHQRAVRQFKLHTAISIRDSAHSTFLSCDDESNALGSLTTAPRRASLPVTTRAGPASTWRHCRAARCCQFRWRPSTCAITVRSGQKCLPVVWRPGSPVPLAGADTASQVGRQCYSSGAIPVATSASRYEDERHHRSCPPTCLCSTVHCQSMS